MAEGKLRKLPIDRAIFGMAFERDIVFHDTCPQTVYLNRETGEMHWVYDDDQDARSEAGISAAENEALRRLIEEAPARFLEIPGRDHGEHHDLLREFLNSDWTENESSRDKAQGAYFGSIGGWKKTVEDQETIHRFYDYRDSKLREMAESFLRDHGIEPVWK
jgi:hypothetical protein